jgi:hypothetical protein
VTAACNNRQRAWRFVILFVVERRSRADIKSWVECNQELEVVHGRVVDSMMQPQGRCPAHKNTHTPYRYTEFE